MPRYTIWDYLRDRTADATYQGFLLGLRQALETLDAGEAAEDTPAVTPPATTCLPTAAESSGAKPAIVTPPAGGQRPVQQAPPPVLPPRRGRPRKDAQQ